MPDPDDGERLAGVWVRVFEEDTAAGAVFRPEDADIPLSRRPRERIELKKDGTAVLLMPGPDDRFVPQPASWHPDGEAIAVRDSAGAVRLRIVERSADRLVVRMADR